MKHIRILFAFAFLFLASCSEERMDEISTEEVGSQEEETNPLEFEKGNEDLSSNFLPTFTNYFGRDRGTSTNRSSSIASEWIHEYDQNDNLVKSYFYELYPYRLLREITYHEIDQDNTLNFEIKEYGYYGLIYSVSSSYALKLDDDLKIIGLGEVLEDVFKEFTDDGWVTKINSVTPDGQIVLQRGYEYDEDGKVLKYISYDTPGVITGTVDYTYNENGDPLSYHFRNAAGAETKVNYYYRQDNTLERLEEEYFENGNSGTKVFTYSLDERLSKQIEFNGDGTKKVVTYTEEEIIEEHFFEDDVKKEVFIFKIQEDRYFLKQHKEYLNGIIQTIKFYTAEGELDYTEYYDENGNLSETVPA